MFQNSNEEYSKKKSVELEDASLEIFEKIELLRRNKTSIYDIRKFIEQHPDCIYVRDDFNRVPLHFALSREISRASFKNKEVTKRIEGANLASPLLSSLSSPLPSPPPSPNNSFSTSPSSSSNLSPHLSPGKRHSSPFQFILEATPPKINFTQNEQNDNESNKFNENKHNQGDKHNTENEDLEKKSSSKTRFILQKEEPIKQLKGSKQLNLQSLGDQTKKEEVSICLEELNEKERLSELNEKERSSELNEKERLSELNEKERMDEKRGKGCESGEKGGGGGALKDSNLGESLKQAPSFNTTLFHTLNFFPSNSSPNSFNSLNSLSSSNSSPNSPNSSSPKTNLLANVSNFSLKKSIEFTKKTHTKEEGENFEELKREQKEGEELKGKVEEGEELKGKVEEGEELKRKVEEGEELEEERGEGISLQKSAKKKTSSLSPLSMRLLQATETLKFASKRKQTQSVTLGQEKLFFFSSNNNFRNLNELNELNELNKLNELNDVNTFNFKISNRSNKQNNLYRLNDEKSQWPNIFLVSLLLGRDCENLSVVGLSSLLFLKPFLKNFLEKKRERRGERLLFIYYS